VYQVSRKQPEPGQTGCPAENCGTLPLTKHGGAARAVSRRARVGAGANRAKEILLYLPGRGDGGCGGRQPCLPDSSCHRSV